MKTVTRSCLYLTWYKYPTYNYKHLEEVAVSLGTFLVFHNINMVSIDISQLMLHYMIKKPRKGKMRIEAHSWQNTTETLMSVITYIIAASHMVLAGIMTAFLYCPFYFFHPQQAPQQFLKSYPHLHSWGSVTSVTLPGLNCSFPLTLITGYSSTKIDPLHSILKDLLRSNTDFLW